MLQLESKPQDLFWFGPPGALYPDGTSNLLKMDDAVPPGGRHTYRWEVRPEFAPTDDDADCLTWVYHSHLDAPKDIASGLIGPLLTCKKGRSTIVLRFAAFEEMIDIHGLKWAAGGFLQYPKTFHTRILCFKHQDFAVCFVCLRASRSTREI